MSAMGPISDTAPTSDEDSDASQDNPDLNELARLRIISYSGHGPLLKTTRALDHIVIGAIAVVRERP